MLGEHGPPVVAKCFTKLGSALHLYGPKQRWTVRRCHHQNNQAEEARITPWSPDMNPAEGIHASASHTCWDNSDVVAQMLNALLTQHDMGWEYPRFFQFELWRCSLWCRGQSLRLGCLETLPFETSLTRKIELGSTDAWQPLSRSQVCLWRFLSSSTWPSKAPSAQGNTEWATLGLPWP